MLTKLSTTYYLSSLIMLCMLLIISSSTQSQELGDSIPNKSDSIILLQTSSQIDSIGLKPSNSSFGLESIVEYETGDSMTMYIPSKIVTLYGNYDNADLTYESINIKSGIISIDFNKSILFAKGFIDSTFKEIKKPIFSEDGQEFRTYEIRYNYKTQQGIIKQVITEESEGFLHGETVKKMENDVMFIDGGKFTTCNLDHPHFDIRFKKAKVIPKDVIVTGPAWLSIADIPTPLVVPFGFFPNKKGRSSGLILPTYGEEKNRGFFLKGGGYYFGISDNLDLALTGDIYSRGSWGVKAASNYVKRYKYRGNLAISGGQTRFGEDGTPEAVRNTDFRVIWKHSQDAKARPNSRFSASVDVGTSTSNKYNAINTQDLLSNTFSSSISYSTRLFNRLNFTASGTHSQNTLNNSVSITLPSVSVTSGQFYPFKRKLSVGKQRWYEKISMNYTMNAKNTVNSIDSILFNTPLAPKLKNGIQHNIPLSSTIKVFKYLTWTNSIKYTERWYWKSATIQYNNQLHEYVVDTITGFKAARDFSVSSSLNTRVYGMYSFKRGPVTDIRHVVSPNVGVSYRPDFGEPKWGYYNYYIDTVTQDIRRYSIFANPYFSSVYGGPPEGKSGKLNLSLGNNFEMKVRSKKDTISGSKKVKLIDNLNFSTSYNMAADSLRWSPISVSARTVLFKKLNLTYNSSFELYGINDSTGQLINTYQWQKTDGKELFYQKNSRYAVTVSYQLASKKKAKVEESAGSEDEKEMIKNQWDNYIDFNNPWSLNFDYSFQHGRTFNYKTGVLEPNTSKTHTFGVRGDVNITPKWKISVRSGYDIFRKEFTYTTVDIYRDLHCWEMSFNWIPIGFYQSYNLTVRVKAAVLQDLKLSKKKTFYDNF